MVRWKGLLTAAVVLAGSPTLVDAAVANPPDARSLPQTVQPPAVRIASGSPHAATGVPASPPAVAGQPVGHGRRAEREAKRAARKLQRRMRKQQEQQEMQPPPDH